MSVAGVKTYARARLVSLGYTEWTDGYSFANIPATMLDSRFHVEVGEISGITNNQDSQDIEVNFTVRLFRKPVLNSKALIDTGIGVVDTVLADLLKCSNRLTQTEIKTVRFISAAVEPLDPSNDNGIVIRINFIALVVISTR